MYTTPQLGSLNVENLVKRIHTAESIILTTHKQCDGDGLGAILALYHALKKIGKKVRVLTVDAIPKKYEFLDTRTFVEVFEQNPTPIDPSDLALIFDTNDQRLVEPLYSELELKCKNILFVDHHPILNQGPEPTPGSFIDTSAASTGEIAFFIIQGLGIRMDKNIAEPLYTSMAFDTQIFRYVKGSPNTHLICASILEFIRHPEDIHRSLFANYTRDKISFIGEVLSGIQYFHNERFAIVNVSLAQLGKYSLDMDDSRDVIDMVMNINSVQAAALFRQDGPTLYKLSLRSKGQIEVLSVAESFGGGGHLYAAGAEIHENIDKAIAIVKNQLSIRVDVNKP